MVVGAHPDDIEIGMGATIHKMIREGHRVIAVDLTDGELTPHGNREIRARETARANEILGLTERRCLDLPNRTLMDSEEARMRLAVVMRETCPDFVVTHLERDAHPDHVAAFLITRGAVLLSRIVKCDLPHDPWRPGKLLGMYCSHLKATYDPNTVLAVSEEDFDAKLNAILAYESQFGKTYGGLDWLKNLITSRERLLGTLVGAPYGEAIFSQEMLGLDDLWHLRGRGSSNKPADSQ